MGARWGQPHGERCFQNTGARVGLGGSGVIAHPWSRRLLRPWKGTAAPRGRGLCWAPTSATSHLGPGRRPLTGQRGDWHARRLLGVVVTGATWLPPVRGPAARAWCPPRTHLVPLRSRSWVGALAAAVRREAVLLTGDPAAGPGQAGAGLGGPRGVDRGKWTSLVFMAPLPPRTLPARVLQVCLWSLGFINKRLALEGSRHLRPCARLSLPSTYLSQTSQHQRKRHRLFV